MNITKNARHNHYPTTCIRGWGGGGGGDHHYFKILVAYLIDEDESPVFDIPRMTLHALPSAVQYVAYRRGRDDPPRPRHGVLRLVKLLGG